MLKHFIGNSVRNLWKSRTYTVINVSGLAIALASFVVILLYINYELSYDRWDPQLKRVYRVTMKTGNNFNDDPTPVPLGPFLKENDPYVTAYTRIQLAGSYEVLIGTDTKQIYQKNWVSADSGFFSVFPYRLLEGDPTDIFTAHNNILITHELALKLFGEEDPIGKTVKLYNQKLCKITGVFALPSTPGHFNAQMIIRDKWVDMDPTNWENYSYTTYVLTKPGVTQEQLAASINHIFYDRHLKKDNQSYEAYLKAGHAPVLVTDAVQDIHNFPKSGGSQFKTTLSLFTLAVLLLLGGAINFSNLSLVKSFKRAKEVGVRKVLGSSPGQIREQFLLEVFLQCLVAFVLAGIIVRFALPAFNHAFGLALHLDTRGALSQLVWQLPVTLVVICLIAGMYPAVVMSRFNAARVLKGDKARGPKARNFSNTLLVVQFAVSVFFISCVMVVALQMRYMKNRDLGLQAAQVLTIEGSQDTRDKNFLSVRSRLLGIPGVEYVSKSTNVPGSDQVDTSSGFFVHNGADYRFVSYKVSEDYFRTISVPVLQGRQFSYDHPEDEDNTVMINESAAKALGSAGSVGSAIRFKGCEVPYQIIGVVKDFHVQGFEAVVQPTLYSISNAHCGFASGGSLLVKLHTSSFGSALAAITQVWKDIEPGAPIQYTFLDQDFAHLLERYSRLQTIIVLFAGISILIALAGLLALTAYMSERRTKEIGIRKVLGAGLMDLTGLLTKDFLILVCIAIVITSPVAWYAMHSWLENFAYHIPLEWWILALSGLIALVLSLITVGLQALKASSTNPVNSLKIE